MRKSALLLLVLLLAPLGSAATTAPSIATPWELIQQAGKIPPTDSPRCIDSRYLHYAPFPPYPKEWWNIAMESEQGNTFQFRLLRQSRSLMQSNRGESGINTPGVSVTAMQAALHSLNSSRNLANITSDSAMLAHLNGRDAEAFGRILDLFNIADCLSQCHLLISQLVADGIEAVGAETIYTIAPSIDFKSRNSTQVRKAITQIISSFLDDKTAKEGWRQSILHELRSSQEAISSQGPGAEISQGFSVAATERDLLLLDKACQSSSYDQSAALLKKCVWPGEMPSIERAFLVEFRILSERRMAAADLAIQLDHHGDWPRNLEELVPVYLPFVPRDLFRSDNAPIGYKIIPHGWPDGKDRPVLFVDAGPDFHLNSEPRLSWYSENKKDARQYRDLTLPTR